MPGLSTAVQSPDRLAALRSTGLLDSPEEPAFDRLTKLATAALRVPVALISLVDQDRQFFKSQCGLPLQLAAKRETPLSHSFCQHVVNLAEPLIVRDARENEFMRQNLAIRDLGVIAYAGVPIRDEDGYVLGSFCAIDTRPRDWSSDEVALLHALSAQATLEITLRSRSINLASDLEQRHAMEEDRRAMNRLTVHDLRTPLSAMLMSLNLVHRLGPLNEPQANYLAICNRNGQALQGIIDNLLDVAGVEQRGAAALYRSDCTAANLVNAAVDQVRPLAVEKAIELSAEMDDHLPALEVDADKIVRVFVNLLGNAIKFTPAGGRIELTTKPDGAKSPTRLQFSITDTGIGMADTARIFEEGVRLDSTAPTRRSAGLGLTFCKRIIEAHGGTIWANSQPDKGSTFHFTLPLTLSSTLVG